MEHNISNSIYSTVKDKLSKSLLMFLFDSDKWYDKQNTNEVKGISDGLSQMERFNYVTVVNNRSINVLMKYIELDIYI